MRILCIDDEEEVLQRTAAKCREFPHVTETVCFAKPEEALAWLSLCCSEPDSADSMDSMPGQIAPAHLRAYVR